MMSETYSLIILASTKVCDNVIAKSELHQRDYLSQIHSSILRILEGKLICTERQLWNIFSINHIINELLEQRNAEVECQNKSLKILCMNQVLNNCGYYSVRQLERYFQNTPSFILKKIRNYFLRTHWYDSIRKILRQRQYHVNFFCRMDIVQEFMVEDIKIQLMQDEVLECQFIYLIRQRIHKSHKIGLTKECIQKFVDLSGQIKEVVHRYGDGSVSFSKFYHIHDDIFCRVSTAGGTIQVDIRKYCDIDQKHIPLKVGITIPGTSFPEFLNALVEIQEEAQSL
ncbi:hypothetical protein ACF0H5_000072 [Mactra antiquata]